MLALLLAATTMAFGPLAIPLGPSGDAFYSPPATLPPTGEGSVVWARQFRDGAALPSASRNYRLLYQTVSPTGKFVAISGTLAVPNGMPPSGGWPLISWAHGTVGDAPQCAPSRSSRPNVEQRMLDAFVARGYAVAQTDYEGNGTPGIHPYMVATAAARDVTDIVSASREIDPQIGRRWIVMGHSEGGASALSTAAVASQIAPDLDLAGAVAYAPFAYPEATLEYELHNGSPNGGLVILGLLIAGFSTVDPRVVPSEMLEPKALQLMPTLYERCVSELMEHSAWSSTVPQNIFRPAGQSGVEALFADLEENDPAYFKISVPTLFVQGVSDSMVSSEGTLTVADRLRRNGTPVTFKAYVHATHGSVLAASISEVAEWVANRFASHS
jgi:pimeloyl-ACP methyl ester carboxylesterase